MSTQTGDGIRGPARGTAAQAIASATGGGASRPGEVGAYVRAAEGEEP